MSWEVEGRSFHNYGEYQRAAADAERRRAVRTAAELEGANERLQRQIRDDRAALDDARRSIEQQMSITRRIESNVRALERNQARLQTLVRQTELRMQEGLNGLERELADQQGKLHGVQVDVGTLRRNHQQHVEQVRRELSSVKSRIEQGLAEAEAQRIDAEKRLNASIQDVDRKLESDRSERARAASDRTALAQAELAAAAEIVARVEAGASSLDVAADVQQVKSRIASARTLVAQQNVSAALGVSTLCRGDAESLEHEARSRKVELETARDDLRQRLMQVETIVGAGASEDVKACYGTECRRLHATVAAAQGRLAGRYSAYRLLEVERREDHELLDRLESEALDIVASAPVVVQAAERRASQLAEVADGLEKVYGEATAVEQGFAVDGDPKSDLIAKLTFGSSIVQLRLSLDGTMRLDGYGHSSNSECATAAHRIVQELQHRAVIGHAHVDPTARQSPRAETAVSTVAKPTSEGV